MLASRRHLSFFWLTATICRNINNPSYYHDQ
nr:MAG TPA: hypothetical protein [Caudoviricetes sp.]